MKTMMTPKERMMAAARNLTPDRVPCAPDISCMIPCRLSEKPFYDILYYGRPGLMKAYLDAVDYFGIDGWVIGAPVQFYTRSQVIWKTICEQKSGDELIVRKLISTPDGDMTITTRYPACSTELYVERMVKNFKNDYKKLLHLFPEITGYNGDCYREFYKAVGDRGMVGIYAIPPGLHIFADYFEGHLEAAVFAYYDYPELFEELAEKYEKHLMKQVEIYIDLGVESILTGGSGSITLQSEKIWRVLSLPAIKKITKMCREAGIISGIHSCGKEKYLIKTCAEETDLDYVNPIEIPPMGDCTLSEIKREYSGRLALMGNLHTTDTMLFGSVEKVRLESLKAIRDAGENGGFILSTGDQVPLNTPYENIMEMVRVAKEFGVYPLDMDRINKEVVSLERKISNDYAVKGEKTIDA